MNALPPRGLEVLWTSPYLPYPATNGGKTRQLALLRQLAARGHRITLLALAKEPPTAADVTALEAFLAGLVVVPRRDRGSAGTLLRAALAPARPVVATVNGCNADYAARFAALLGSRAWDVVQLEHSYGFEPLDAALGRAGTPFLLTEHNVESRLVAGQFARLPGPLRLLGTLDAARARAWERRVLRRAGAVVAITGADAAAFRALGAREVVVVPNGIDTGALAGVAPDPAARRLFFLGNYDYPPNRDAVRWLCEEIMPRIWAAAPDVTLLLHGHAMPAVWRQRWPDERIDFAGYAPDLAGAHGSSSAFVAPLRSGGGSKLKVLEAMAASLPVIGTREAMSGLAAVPGQDWMEAETAAEIAAAALALLDDPARAAAVGRSGRALVVAHHDWQATADGLEAAWRDHARRNAPDAIAMQGRCGNA